jgi:ABC-type phosphate transport system substrate-binding protein
MRKSISVALVGATVVACGLGMVGTANADNQPRVTDIVGVGSDTVQYLGDFLADGDNIGASGYNTNNPSRRMFNIDATADAAGRAVYGAAGVAISTQVVLRSGLSPVNRPNGSGAGITAINTDAAHSIDFVRASRLPKLAEQNIAVATPATATSPGTPALGALHSFQIAVDGLQMATNNVTNAPANITCADIVGIYKGTITTWNQVTGNSAGSTATIVPYTPQSGSGTRSDFESVLKACNGNVAVTYGPSVLTGEEHDPSVLTTGVNAPNAIAPFSSGRFNLLQSGYLSTYTPNTIKLQGTPVVGTTLTSGAADVFYQARKLFIIVRDADVNSTIPFQNGSTLNWVKTLFGTGTSWAGKPGSAGLFTSAGVIQAWSDQGVLAVG